MTSPRRPKIAIATGDAGGIGAEIAIKAARDVRVREACWPILVSDPALLGKHARASGLASGFHVVDRLDDARPSEATVILDPHFAEAGSIELGEVSAASGRASLVFARAAIKAALQGAVDAVVAAPQNQRAIALAGIEFDGYPSFVARETGLSPHDVFLMLCFGSTRIVHCTLHVSVREAIGLITRERVLRVIAATDRALRRLGVPAPAICVGGLNPHAGEDGLFGVEDRETIKPAIDEAVADGIGVCGPFGADSMFLRKGVDAFIVMLHDQGHIAAKLMARNAVAALTIGSPILFSSVAHGSAHDIAGKGAADPRALIEAVLRLSKANQRLG